VLKFKCLAKRMSYAKVDCSHLNANAKRLNTQCSANSSVFLNTRHIISGKEQ